MVAKYHHFIGNIDKLEDIQKLLSLAIASSTKISRKGDKLHVFVDRLLYPEDQPSLIADKALVRCVGCDKCDKKPVRSKNLGKFSVYPPLLLLPNASSPILAQDAAELLSEFPNCTHVALNAPIKGDDRIRSPQIIPVAGDFGQFEETSTPTNTEFAKAFWATCTQNGIFQTWAPFYTMFSRGNITEKKRVLTTFAEQCPIENTTVVDLYCGIGYFTFSYAKQRPKRIYCWELNLWSIEGLLRAARTNKFNARVVHLNEPYIEQLDDFIVVFAEDNQNALNRVHQLDLTNLSHINMGLLPDAHAAIPVALQLCQHGTTSSSLPVQPIVHLHENIRPDDMEHWKATMAARIGQCIFVETIKRYSPGVFHVCGDFMFDKKK